VVWKATGLSTKLADQLFRGALLAACFVPSWIPNWAIIAHRIIVSPIGGLFERRTRRRDFSSATVGTLARCVCTPPSFTMLLGTAVVLVFKRLATVTAASVPSQSFATMADGVTGRWHGAKK
jgi:hypothetical protein